MSRKPRIELLSPDLDLGTRFVPGYDLDSPADGNIAALDRETIAGIALALWELSGTEQCSSAQSPWRMTQLTELWEGAES